MNKKHEEMKIEAVENIIEELRNGYEGDIHDLHHEVFNTSYYIIGTYEAKEALKEYDVFEAIEVVKEYENHNFGECYTDLENPEKLVNMLFYIIGDEVLSNYWNYDYIEDETRQAMINALKNDFNL